MGLLPFLLPFVWLLEVDSCGGSVPRTEEITGSMIVGKFDLEGWMVIVPTVLVALLTPFLAPRVKRLGLRLLVHVAGFVAVSLMAYGAFFAMFFTIFSTREAQGVGWIVLAVFVGLLIEALARLGLGLSELLAARRAPSPPS